MRPLVDRAHRNGERLAKLVTDMLDIQNIESGQLSLTLLPVAVSDVIAQAVNNNAALAAKHGIKFEIAPMDTAMLMLADRERAPQIMKNLLSNAENFSPKGEVVTVRAQSRDKFVRISLTDRGPDGPEQFRERIFDKFAQADSASTRYTEGSGLGLAVCHLLVDKMGGEIGYESQPEKGTTFFFELPATT